MNPQRLHEWLVQQLFASCGVVESAAITAPEPCAQQSTSVQLHWCMLTVKSCQKSNACCRHNCWQLKEDCESYVSHCCPCVGWMPHNLIGPSLDQPAFMLSLTAKESGGSFGACTGLPVVGANANLESELLAQDLHKAGT